MKAKPILFTGANVKAIMDGRKSMTRRVVRPQPYCPRAQIEATDDGWLVIPSYANNSDGDAVTNKRFRRCPYRPGDLLYVRETWAHAGPDAAHPYIYRAEWVGDAQDHYANDCYGDCPKWKPSIHMPRIASRLTLRISNVRVERLQSISEEDAIAEGVEFRDGYWLGGIHPIKGTLKCWPTVTMAFAALIDSINGSRGFWWKDNYWVWIPEWDKVWRQNVDEVMKAL